MKKIIGIAFCLCLVAVFAFADTSGEIVAIDKDANGNIRVWTSYVVDGKNVESRYPKMINSKEELVYVYCTRYNKRNFLGMSKTEIAERIDEDLKSHSRRLIQKEFNKNAPKTINQIRIDYNAQANQDFVDISFPVLMGRKVIEKEAIIVLDSNNDDVKNKEIRLKTDGTKTITDIIP